MKKLLVFGVLMSIAFTSFSQKRVSGYYRKNGTYVSGYTRGGSSSYSGGEYSSSSSIEEETPKEQMTLSTLKIDNDGFNVYVSVLKYNDQVIDLKQIERQYNWYEFDHLGYDKKYDNLNDIVHTIDSKKITQEETLKLVSEFGWSLKDGILSNRVYSKILDKKVNFPSFLTHSFQIVKLK